ncbi:DJ-1 family glyoxalase III [Paratractidigestivibacter sp.]|uniref:DJ-1 family glyoxalase III n=1 Tax=Paratractidigestivibacter sp. TaxID=2847316 RepID=UPI002AC9D5AD|nr:DJ-1 family glyoxalase III [Paratractidigestivibacter sp.]
MAFTALTDKRVAVFFAAGFEEVEAIAVVDLLFRAGIPCDMVSITNNLQVTSSREVTVTCDRTIEDDDFDFDAYDMLVLPGGIPGMPNLKACEPLCEALKKHAAEGRGVAAICASPSILAELGILAGKRTTANPHFQQSVVEGGGILEAGERAVTDGNVITSQGMATATWFGLEIVKRYVSDEVVEHVKEGIVLMD